jgi:hypothetical protein
MAIDVQERRLSRFFINDVVVPDFLEEGLWSHSSSSIV